MTSWNRILPWIAFTFLAIAFAAQYQSVRGLRAEMTRANRTVPEYEALPTPDRSEPGSLISRPISSSPPADIIQRLAALEDAVAQLTRSAEHLMERGDLPLSDSKRSELYRAFTDPLASERSRLNALQLLRRTEGLTDDIAAQAMAWLNSSTNGRSQRALLSQLEGATNSVLKQPILALAAAEDSELREQAVESLRGFAGDPEVQSLLWERALADPEEDVREEAMDIVQRLPLTPARQQELQQLVLDPSSPVDARLSALHLLQRSGAETTQATAALAQLAQEATDPTIRRNIFRAFDRTDDPAVKLPLVHGLRDPNPIVREEAIDALADFRSDPAVTQWLQYVAQNDADPAVRREAHEALMDD